MNTVLICITVSLLAFSYGQDSTEELTCPGGYCVAKHLCPDGTYVDDPTLAQNTSLVGLRFDDDDSCENYLLKCCQLAQAPSTTNPPDIFEEPSLSCGQFNENGLVYEVHNNGSLAQYAEFPWVVYIMTKTNKQSSPTDFVCGGALIHPQFVVTTAHNTDEKSDLIARFGEWDISTKNEPYPHQDISVKEIIKHPDYVHNPIQNDIALLLLTEEVQYKKHIRHICLPQSTDQFVGKRCISNGWGEQRGAYANVMKKLMLPVIAHPDCNRMLRFAGLGPFYKLREGFMCAGGEAGVDMCKGDGGSPLACQTDSGAFVLAGIVSWGIGCGGHDLPGVYVAVNRYVNWINENIVNNILNVDIVL